jgi:fucose 4-O-acetylase-like acetyltransferase
MAGVEKAARDATWDIARGIGMVLVIYGHLLEPIFPERTDLGKPFTESAFAQWQVIYSFHMMLFFLVSGAVNRSLPKKTWPEVLRGSLRLLALAWVVHILGVIFAVAFGYFPEGRQSLAALAQGIFEPIALGFLWSVGVLWFLTSLCFVQILAYAVLRHTQSVVVVLVAMAATAGSAYVPNYYLLKTWMPGLSFFILGFLLSKWQVRIPFWLWIPLLPLLIWLAPLNTGCSFTLSQACYNVGPGLFGVWMFAGVYGFLPLFFLSAAIGSIAVISLSAGLAKLRFTGLLAYMGRKSLDLFIINGFVATFLNTYIAQIVWPPLTVLIYVGLFIGIVTAHLAAMQILNPVLAWIDAAAVAIANGIVRLLTGQSQRIEVKPA